MKKRITLFLIALCSFYSINAQDFVIDSITYNNDELVLGSGITFTYYYSNISSIDALSYNRIYYYLSKDTIYDYLDYYISYAHFSSMLANTQYNLNRSFNPSDLEPGDYYLISLADGNNRYTETNEDNNTFVKPLKVIATSSGDVDLVPAGIEGPDTIELNERIQGTYYVTNIGNGEPTQFYNAIYLSKDTIYNSSNDYYINNYYTSDTVRQGDTVEFNYNRYISGIKASPGMYYLLNITDVNGYISETSEENNVSYKPVILNTNTDIYGSNLVVPTNYSEGPLFEFSFDLHKTVPVDISNILVHAYLSSDNNLDDSDIYLSEQYFYMYEDTVSNENWSIYFPDVNAGNYYLILSIDHNNSRAETNENNNILVSSAINITNTTSDLTIDSVTISSDTVTAGTSLPFTIGISNSGSDTLNQILLSIFLSKDSVYDPYDVYLNNFGFYLNETTQTYTVSTSAYIQNYITEGDYYLLAIVDNDNLGNTRIPELDETNNLFGVPVFVENLTAYDVDMLIDSLNLYGYDQTGYTRNVSYATRGYFTNLGTNTTPSNSYVSLYLSKDSVFDFNDILQDRNYYSSGLGNSLYETYFSNTIPENIDTGDYYFITVVNHAGSYSETNLDNNIYISKKIKIFGGSFDFEVVDFTADNDTFFIGESSLTHRTFTNNNDEIYGPTLYTTIYLSEDAVSDYFDLRLYNQNFSNINPQDTFTYNTNISIPNGIVEGNYYLIFKVDYNDNIDEFDEDNNEIAIPITVLKKNIDYEITNVEISNELVTGISSSVVVSITNNGTNESPNDYVHIFLSETSDYDKFWSKSITSSSFGSIASNGTIDDNFNLSISNEVETGNYYLHIVVDENNDKPETNEGNNVYMTIPVSIVESTFDFKVNTTVLSKESITFNESNNVQVTLLNQGNTYISYGYFAAYISPDPTYDAGDQSIYTSNVSFTQGNEVSSTRSFNFSVNTDYPPRTYYLIIRADYNENVDETDETNNTYAIPFTVTAPDIDLKLTYAEFTDSDPDTLITGVNENIRFSVTNIGKETSSSFRVGFYLSANNKYDNFDAYLTNYYYSSLASGDTVSNTRSINISGIADGNYYIILRADYQESIFENNENNNFIAIPIYVKQANVDLQVPTVSVSSPDIKQGTNFYLYFSALNTGKTDAYGHYARIYISRDSILDSQDKNIYDRYIGSLQSMQQVNYSNWIICAADTIGEHYIIVEEDYQKNIAEINENNNINKVKINVLSSDIDLTINTFTLTDTAINQNSYLYTGSQTQNLGTDNTGTFINAYYLSTDTILDYFDILLYSRSLSLNGGNIYNYNRSIYINSNYFPGDYYLILKADRDNIIGETNENNNTKYVKFKINGTPAIPDITVSSLTFNDSVLYNTDKLTYNITFATDKPITRTTYLGIYLSKDTLLDDKDYLFHTRGIGSFTTTTSTSYNSSNYNYGNFETGDYYFLFVADAYKYILETNELNNVVYKPVQFIKRNIDAITSDISAPVSVSAGDRLYPIDVTISNLGDPNDFQVYNNLRLSKDTVPDILDLSINYFWSYFDTTKTSDVRGSYSIDLPNLEEGIYYLINTTDVNQNVYESNEDNNVFYKPITITANRKDIGVENLVIENDQARPGDTTQVTFDIIATDIDKITKSFNTRVYVSEDETLDFFDQSIENLYLDSIIPGSPYHHQFEYVMALGTGKYYMIVETDNNENVTENNEENNTMSKSFLVKYPKTLDVKSISEGEFKLYPNPASSIIYVEFDDYLDNNATFYIYDVNGKMLKTKKLNNVIENTIDVSDLQKGVYFMRVLNENRVFVNKFIVN